MYILINLHCCVAISQSFEEDRVLRKHSAMFVASNITILVILLGQDYGVMEYLKLSPKEEPFLF